MLTRAAAAFPRCARSAAASERVTRTRGPRAARLAAALALSVVATAGAAAQAAQATVALDTAACPAIPEAAIRRIVGIEIGDLLAGPGDVPTDGNRLAMICQEGVARLAARGAGGGQPIERELRLAEFPGDAAPRALALAGVEMLAALDPAVRERIQIRQSPAAAPAPEPPSRADRSVAAVGIAISAVRREFLGSEGFGGWGGRIDLDRGFGQRFVVGIDVELDGGSTAVALGEARALLVSAGAFGGLRAAGARLAGSLSLGARVGLASLEGTPAGGAGATGATALRPWWGPAIAARGWIRTGPIGFVAAIEAGIAARGARGLADGATVLAVEGAWLLAGLGVRF